MQTLFSSTNDILACDKKELSQFYLDFDIFELFAANDLTENEIKNLNFPSLDLCQAIVNYNKVKTHAEIFYQSEKHSIDSIKLKNNEKLVELFNKVEIIFNKVSTSLTTVNKIVNLKKSSSKKISLDLERYNSYKLDLNAQIKFASEAMQNIEMLINIETAINKLKLESAISIKNKSLQRPILEFKNSIKNEKKRIHAYISNVASNKSIASDSKIDVKEVTQILSNLVDLNTLTSEDAANLINPSNKLVPSFRRLRQRPDLKKKVSDTVNTLIDVPSISIEKFKFPQPKNEFLLVNEWVDFPPGGHLVLDLFDIGYDLTLPESANKKINSFLNLQSFSEVHDSVLKLLNIQDQDVCYLISEESGDVAENSRYTFVFKTFSNITNHAINCGFNLVNEDDIQITVCNVDVNGTRDNLNVKYMNILQFFEKLNPNFKVLIDLSYGSILIQQQ